MKPTIIPHLRRAIVIALLALPVLALSAPFAHAAATVVATAAIVPAFGMMDVVGDRTRMIQFSIGAVALGIALLWWGNKSA
jgi:apolipoprotein N-acyltransferase